MKYCQGTKCHEYKTKDRIRGSKGDKHYETRKNKSFYNGEFCSMMCRDDWYNEFGKRAIDHFGRIYEPKRTDASGAWYKSYNWVRQDSNRTVYNHFFVNDLLGQRILITEQQYQDDNLTSPPS
jgi:hypothetical protein